MSYLTIVPHILLPLSMPLFLTLPPFPCRGIISTIAILSLSWLALTSPFPVDTQLRYGFSQSWFWYIPTIAKLLIPYAHQGPKNAAGFKGDTEHAYWHSGHPEEAANLRFGWTNFRWAMALWFNPRGVGWNYEGKDIPKLSTRTRISKRFFLADRAVGFFLYYCLTDVVVMYTKSFGFPNCLETMSMADKIKIALPAAAMIRGNWIFQWNWAAFLGVALGLSEPEDWPAFFGPITEVTSIASFWGLFWQQILHESVLTYSRWLISFFGLRRHGTTAYTMHLFTGFFISGIFHFITLAYAASYPPQDEKFAKTMFFFMMQPVGISFEQWVKSMVEYRGQLFERLRLGNWVAKVFGYTWVLSFLFVTGWPFLEVYFKIGMAEWDVPYSFVGLLWRILSRSRDQS